MWEIFGPAAESKEAIQQQATLFLRPVETVGLCELEGALNFGRTIVCGWHGCRHIGIFDVGRPGRGNESVTNRGGPGLGCTIGMIQVVNARHISGAMYGATDRGPTSARPRPSFAAKASDATGLHKATITNEGAVACASFASAR